MSRALVSIDPLSGDKVVTGDRTLTGEEGEVRYHASARPKPRQGRADQLFAAWGALIGAMSARRRGLDPAGDRYYR